MSVELAIENHVARVTIDRPDRMNAIDKAAEQRLQEIWAELENNRDVRCIVLTGSGDRAFSTGADMKDGGADGLRYWAEPRPGGFGGIALRTTLDIPVIARVNGYALGGGFEMVLGCDIVIAAESAVFVQAFIKIGLIPDVGGTFILPRLVGQARAMGLAMLGEEITGKQAAEWGMIWRAVDDDRVMDEATTVARQLASQPTVALGLIKRAIQASATNDLHQQLELERDLQRQAGKTEDFAEGVNAFLDRRPPIFKGR